MAELILEPSATADWQRLVHEAAQAATRELDEDLESYLVMLLTRTLRDVDSVHRLMALDYLEGVTATGQLRSVRLRDVGDNCLLMAGMFPQRAERRLVRIGYFVELGRSAYQQLGELLSQSTAQLYSDLSTAFVALMEVLQAMRELGGAPTLSPLEAIELWQDTGSPRALDTLRLETQATPVSTLSRRAH
ncbi:MAG: hypothetical protein PVG82_07040 [Chromatiales bacterium]|jgi:hypothetical protein